MFKLLYLDFDSTYRNRNLWPHIGEFEVGFSKPKTASDALDPVSNAAPIHSWVSNEFSKNQISTPTASDIIGEVYKTEGKGSMNSPSVIVFEVTNGSNLQKIYNYYKHATLQSGSLRRKIIEYQYLGHNIGMVNIEGTIELKVKDEIKIIDPTDFSNTNNSILFVPCDIQEDLVGYYIYNNTVNQSTKIKNYDKHLNVIHINGAPINTWLSNHQFSIRKELPIFNTQAKNTSVNHKIIFNNQMNITVGMFVRITKTNEISRITKVDNDLLAAYVYPPFKSNPASQQLEILGFSHDNVGSIINDNKETSIYSIKLLNLTVPSHIDEKFVYVEISTQEPFLNNLTTNNPHATKSSFKVLLNNSSSPIHMTQLIKFTHHTIFKIRVLKSDGQVIKNNERLSPYPPKQNEQISMLLELCPLQPTV